MDRGRERQIPITCIYNLISLEKRPLIHPTRTIWIHSKAEKSGHDVYLGHHKDGLIYVKIWQKLTDNFAKFSY